MPDLTTPDLPLNTMTVTNSFGFLILPTHQVGLQVTSIFWNSQREACGMSWDDERRALQKCGDVLNSVSEDGLVQVFRNWMTRLEQSDWHGWRVHPNTILQDLVWLASCPFLMEIIKTYQTPDRIRILG
jgi:hypothetical protein